MEKICLHILCVFAILGAYSQDSLLTSQNWSFEEKFNEKIELADTLSVPPGMFTSSIKFHANGKFEREKNTKFCSRSKSIKVDRLKGKWYLIGDTLTMKFSPSSKIRFKIINITSFGMKLAVLSLQKKPSRLMLNLYEETLVGKWQLFSIEIQDSINNFGIIELKDIYKDSLSDIYVFTESRFYQRFINDSLVENGTWKISKDGRKLKICDIIDGGKKSCGSHKLKKTTHDYSNSNFEGFGDICEVMDTSFSGLDLCFTMYKKIDNTFSNKELW